MGRGDDKEASEWERYRELVPQHVRNDLKAQMLQAEMLGYSSFLKMATHITSEVVSGNIPPSIAKEARAWSELIMTAIAAKNLQDKDKSGNATLVTQLTSARKQAKRQARAITHDTTQDFITDGLETLDGEPIAEPLEANWTSSTPVADESLNEPGE